MGQLFQQLPAFLACQMGMQRSHRDIVGCEPSRESLNMLVNQKLRWGHYGSLALIPDGNECRKGGQYRFP